MNTNKIFLEGMEFFAFHGHYPEEKNAGNKFVIDLTLYTDTRNAELSDNLNDALNYQVAYVITRDIVLNTKSNLLEKIASDILDALFNEFMQLEEAIVRIRKINPPMGGKIESVGVEIRHSRK